MEALRYHLGTGKKKGEHSDDRETGRQKGKKRRLNKERIKGAVEEATESWEQRLKKPVFGKTRYGKKGRAS